MGRLKGLKVRKLTDKTWEVTPLMYGKRGSTMTMSNLKQVGAVLADVVVAVLATVGKE